MVRILIGLMATALMAGLVFWIGDDPGPGTVSAFVDADGNCQLDNGANPGFGYIIVNQRTHVLVSDIHCVVEPGKDVKGNITVVGNGQLTIDGFLDGHIKANTTGTITVNGIVRKHVTQKGTGPVIVNAGSTVDGNVDCSGTGINSIDPAAVTGIIKDCPP